MEQSNVPIFIFYHICLGGPWQEVLQDQLRKLKDSGLLDRASSFKCGVLGPASEYGTLLTMLPSKAEVIFYNESYSLFEFPTLMALQEHARENEGHYLYFHTKGVSRFCQETTDWRHLMEYFTIEKYQDAVTRLEEGFDCFGVNWHEQPTPHFSGNFWWASAAYLRKLKPLVLSSDRFICEFFLGKENPKAFCAWESGVNHYHQRYPAENYLQK